MIKIAITGSLASGKTTVAKLMSGNRYPIFSADKTVKNLYRKKIFINKIKRKFNFKNTKDIKKKIKNLIKKDKKILKKLELIIHPLVRREMRIFMKRKKNIKIKIFEIPLLIESKLTKFFDVTIFVGSKKNIRLRRYLKNGGNKKIFTILDKRQIKSSKKIKKSDHVVYNNSSLIILKKKIKLLLRKYE
tara:strand:- start:2131 stop:2697 length:567 start_codon:yes stop_codon:yes gene_type:complete